MVEARSALRRRRSQLEDRLERHGLLHTLSAARFQLNRALEGTIKQWASGRVLEAGSGRSPYRLVLAARAESITRLDIDPVHAPDIRGDVQDMHMIPDGSFDTVLSTQVLEHVPRPQDAFSEFARILRPGGVLILTAPHLSMIHEAPHDYFRYTRYGLETLCHARSLEAIELRATGGLLSFLGHPASVALLMIVGKFPGLFWIVWAINYLILVRGLDIVDRVIGMRALFPCDHLLVTRRV